MPNPLNGVLVKVIRAKQHFNELDAALNTWSTSEQKDHAPTLKFHRERQMLDASLTEVQPPDVRWPLIAGDIVHNLRSALDHLACQLALLNGKGIECCTETFFPICSSPEYFVRARKRLNGLFPDEPFALIERLQPYHAGDIRDATLWIVSELDRIDKHRELVVVAKKFRAHEVRLTINESQSLNIPTTPDWQSLENGAPLGSISIREVIKAIGGAPKPKDKMRVAAHTQVEVLLDETGLLCDGKPVDGIMRICIDHIETMVGMFQRFFPT